MGFYYKTRTHITAKKAANNIISVKQYKSSVELKKQYFETSVGLLSTDQVL